jgi:NTE family protein
MGRKKVGLALGSGAARGLAHIGVLRVLKNEGVPIDMIAGTSMGAVIGAVYALRGNITRMEEIASGMSRMQVLSLVDLTLPRTGLITGQKITTWAKSLIGRDIQFNDLKTPFACVATDIMTGREIVIDEGSVLEAVRASISMPGIFSVVKREGKYLVDGGLVNPVPVSTVRKIGAEFIIAVNVIPDIGVGGTSRMREKSRRGVKAPNIIDVLMQSTYIGSQAMARAASKDADIVIEPQVAHIGLGDFHRAQECILQGKLAAEDSIPKLKQLLASD